MYVMRLDTIDIYHFMPLSVGLTFAADHKVSRQQKPIGFIFSHTFQLIWMKVCAVMKQLS